MFDFIRKHQRWVLAVLIVLVVPSFVFLGVSGYTNMVSGDSDLAKVGKTTITEQAYDSLLRSQFDSLQSSLDEDFDPAMLDQPEVRRALLDRLIERQLLVELAQDEYFSASDNALREHISSLPELQEDGVFSPERYEQVLRMVGLDTQGFEQSQRAELALARVTEPILLSAYLPEQVQEMVIQTMVDGREVQKSMRPLTDELSNQPITDQEVEQWYQDRRESYAMPEYINIEYVVLNEQAARDAVSVPNQDELMAYYEQNKNRFRTAGRAHIAHILLAVAQGASEDERNQAYNQAQELAAQAQAQPDDFAQLAQEHSADGGSAQQGGDLGWLSQGTLPETLDEAIFALEAGTVSEVIEGADGFHIFKVIELEPEQVQSFEQVQDKILDEVIGQLAADHFADMATRLTELIYEQSDSLEPAANALGLTLYTATGMGREGALRAPIFSNDERAVYRLDDAEFLEDPQLRRALFDRQSLSKLENAGVVEIAPDLIVAARATEHVPAHIPALDELRATVENELSHHKALAALKQEVDAEISALQSGSTEAEGFTEPIQISRTQPHDLGRADLDALLAVSTTNLPAFVAIQERDGYAIYKINQVKQTQLSDLDQRFLRTQLLQLWQDAEERAVMAALAEQIGVEELPGAEQIIFATDGDF